MNTFSFSHLKTPAGIALLYAFFAGLWIVASSYLLTSTINDPLLQTRLEMLKGLAFVAVTSTLLYLLLDSWREPFGVATVQKTDIRPPSLTRLVLLLIAMAMVVPLIGLAIVKVHIPQTEQDTYRNLESIARLKAEQIENWLGERNGDGMALASDESFAVQADKLAHNKHDERLLKPVFDRFTTLLIAYRYDSILLLDSGGEILAAVGEHTGVPPALRKVLRLSLDNKQVRYGDIFHDESGQVHLDWIVPLLVSGTQGKRAVAAVVLRVNLAHFLFPLIQTWPTTSVSGETVLARRDNESVILLNELRHRQGADMIQRLSMADVDLPAAIALRETKPGTMQGKDYAGVSVLAAYRPVASTDWRIIAKIDRSEAIESVWTMVYWIGLAAFAATMVIMAALLLLWRQQRRAQNMALQVEKAKADRLLRQFFDLPFVGMAITSPEAKRWIQFNDYLCVMLGYSREELIEKSWAELTHPDDIEANIAVFERVMRGEAEGYVIDKRFIRKDGAVIFATIDARCVRKPDGAVDYFVTTIQDITARKQAEAALVEREEIYRSIVTLATDGIVLVDADTLRFAEFNDAACQGLGYSREEFTALSVPDIQGEMDADGVAKRARAILEKGGLDFETLHRHKDGSLRDMRVSNRAIRLHGHTYFAGIWADITARKQLERQLSRRLRHLDVMERITRISLNSKSIDELLERVLDEILVVFNADRAWFLYPCDPDAPSWSVPMERTRPEWPGAFARGMVIPMTTGVTDVFREVLASAEPLPYGPAASRHIPAEIAEQFSIRSQIQMALRPRIGSPWVMGLHHCAQAQAYDEDELLIFKDIGQRVADALSSMIILKNLRESEQKFMRFFMQAPIPLAVVNKNGLVVYFNDRLTEVFGYTAVDVPTLKEWWQLAYPDESYRQQVMERWGAAVAKAAKEGTDIETAEYRVTCMNGAERFAMVGGILLEDNILVTLIDITERKQIEEENYLLLTLGKAIAEAENFISALAVSIKMICENAGWDIGEVWLPSPDGTHLDIAAPYYCRIEGKRGFRNVSEKFTFAPGVGLPGRVWASGKSAWIPDVMADANFPRAPFSEEFGIRAAVGIPIMTENACVAVLEFFMSGVRPADERMIAIISAVATQLGTAFQRKLAEERIQRLANFDLLTGLPNRALFAERFNSALGMAQRNNGQLALMYVDLDHFKNINETLGQRIGDQLLVEVAARLKAAVHDEDTVSRQGGDEFILLLPVANVNDATHMAAKLLASIAQHFQIGQHELVVTPSIGIAMYPGDGTDFETLSGCADTAMYRAKADGRNTYRFFTPGMQERSARSLQLENALRRALERDELSLHYQPQVSLQDGRIIGAEALLRWQHPELGMVSPAEFIPVAESSGQILKIGEWVMRTAIAQLKTWMDGGMVPMVIAVNLSAVQFRHASLPELVTRILDEAELPAQYLELELTEGVTMDDPLAAIAVMDDLHERGIRMSIDDFGTGYSSLNYLKKFKVYKLKIDQSFVRDISADSEDKAIVSAIIHMANSLGMQTIAEGVETAAQLAFLRLQGCDQVQGYYFSKPLPAEQFEAFARKKLA